MIILGIETSCDECAAAVVQSGRKILSSEVATQIALHAPFGGVVPEVASRSHLETIRPVIGKAVESAGCRMSDIDAVAVTQRPGLIGSLLVGMSAAKGLALALGIPLIPVNHVEAHAYACLMTVDEPPYPLAALVVSGGHTSLYRVRSPLDLELEGRTIDDAAGEAFDKVASILGLGYPGGPAIDKAARGADPGTYALPRPMPSGRKSLDFSFSGLKTAVLYRCRGMVSKKKRAQREEPPFDREDSHAVAAMAASFQAAVVEVLTTRLFQAAERFEARAVAVGGGVAANTALRDSVRSLAASRGIQLLLSPRDLATDNAAMIAGLAYQIHRSGQRFDIDIDASAC